MLLEAGKAQKLGSTTPRLGVGEVEKQKGAWAGKRVLFLDQKPAFELSFWCGTCAFIFERQTGANEMVDLEELSEHLNKGLTAVNDDAVDAFAELLPEGEFIPLLTTLNPRLVVPSGEGDYFSEEQLATWEVDSFWGLPGYPRTPYYRALDTPVDEEDHLYEFVVPMVPPSWNEAATVARHREKLRASALPTAVSLSILDVCQPAMLEGPDYYRHWCLTHYLLDGHHKVQAAAEGGHQLQLLSLLSIDQSLAARDEVMRVPSVLAQEPATRTPSPG